jgi:hypothetical protein
MRDKAILDRMNRIDRIRNKCPNLVEVSLYRWNTVTSSFKILLILLILSKNSVPSCLAQGTGKAGKQAAPAVERVTENLYRVGKAVVDTQARTVTCPGQINMDTGSIEYLAVAPRGKTHESLLLVDVRPLHLQLALLLLDLEPKNVLSKQGERTTPKGAPVEIYVRWRDAKGDRREERAETLVAELPSGRPMPAHNWVFTGSRILPQGFEADLQKSLVAVWHDPSAILDNPLPGGANNAYIVNAKRVPRQGTPVEFVVKAAATSQSK